MPDLPKSKRLKKELSLLNVYTIATGSTLGAGFFLLPGLAAIEAGPALALAYMLAALPLIPAIFSIVELSTAMPRVGGVYYFIDRSLGPMMGTLGGIGSWFAVLFKVSFALMGMSAYLALFFPQLPVTTVAVVLAVAFGAINMLGVRRTGRFQIFLECGLLTVLAGFIVGGLPAIEPTRFQGFFHKDMSSILSTAGLVYVSYIGVTNVTSLSEEVKNPERNLPLGIFLALGTVMLIYFFGTLVMVGVMPMETLQGNFTPPAAAASVFFGEWGVVVISGAAILAFLSVTNSGILSASRYPLAMGRDHLIPSVFQKTRKNGAPAYSILVTVAAMVMALCFLEPDGIAKLASAFQLLAFALVNLAVIVMRESHIESYDPRYRSPFYPWTQIIGFFLPFLLIFEMGWALVLFSGVVCLLSGFWFFAYGRSRIRREGAICHVFERLAHRRTGGLDRELRGILREKGLREEDPYHEVVVRGFFLDIPTKMSFEEVVQKASGLLAQRITLKEKEIGDAFLQGTRVGVTPVAKQAALPHIRTASVSSAELVLVRSQKGVLIHSNEAFCGVHPGDQLVHAIFFLVSPEANPGQHLRILAQIAERIDDECFMEQWLKTANEQELKEILLREDHFLSLHLATGSPAAPLIGLPLKVCSMPEGCLVALIHRNTGIIIPSGSSVLLQNDRLTIIGEPEGILQLKRQYGKV
ncbi:MAG: amino acid permease [Ignavibacteriales bacterium]|nr:amino acid permease [Ignavibacteriales bacterium]